MELERRQFVAGLAAASLLPGHSAAAPADALTPEAFGAKGDGRTNDTDAFAALSTHVNARGGGTILLRPVTYIVGKQGPSRGGKADFAFAPIDILHFVNCRGDIVIRGNGAKLICAAGLRYGGFDRGNGKPLPDARANLDLNKRAVPYLAMIHAENCSGNVEISNLELDGNLHALQIGGRYSKAGWQAGASGIRLIGSKGAERLSRIHCHHHAQDGIILTGASTRRALTIVSDTLCEDNGRVGCSITRGRNYSFKRCKFRRSGRSGLRSAPAAGVDIEAESGPIRNLVFSECEFADNAGFGLVANAGDSEQATFTNCTFIGTTNWAAWPNKPRFRFLTCLFVGQIVHVYGDSDPLRAAQFVDCSFRDDPAMSPTGQVFGGRTRGHPAAFLTRNPNVLFSRCRFKFTHDMVLPTSKPDVIYTDCRMSQASAKPSRPVGTYYGTTTISGNADLEGSVIRGTVILNGTKLTKTP
jgi:hypothetical protein